MEKLPFAAASCSQPVYPTRPRYQRNTQAARKDNRKCEEAQVKPERSITTRQKWVTNRFIISAFLFKRSEFAGSPCPEQRVEGLSPCAEPTGLSAWIEKRLDNVTECHTFDDHFARPSMALQALVSGGSITKAATEAGVARETVSRWVHPDPVFLALIADRRSRQGESLTRIIERISEIQSAPIPRSCRRRHE